MKQSDLKKEKIKKAGIASGIALGGAAVVAGGVYAAAQGISGDSDEIAMDESLDDDELLLDDSAEIEGEGFEIDTDPDVLDPDPVAQAQAYAPQPQHVQPAYGAPAQLPDQDNAAIAENIDIDEVALEMDNDEFFASLPQSTHTAPVMDIASDTVAEHTGSVLASTYSASAGAPAEDEVIISLDDIVDIDDEIVAVEDFSIIEMPDDTFTVADEEPDLTFDNEIF